MKRSTLFTVVVVVIIMALSAGVIAAQDTDTPTDSADDTVTELVGRGRPGGPRGHGPAGRLIELVATKLGVEPMELVQSLEEGTSLADLLTAANIDVDSVLAEALADATEHINQAVADGKLTQEQADERLATLEEHINTMITSTEHPQPPEGGCQNGPHNRGPRQGGPRGGGRPPAGNGTGV